MKYKEQIKPISYLKANASKIAKETKVNDKTFIITQNGEATLAVMGIGEYQRLQGKLALQKIIAMSKDKIKRGKSFTLDQTITILNQKTSMLKTNGI